MGKTDFLFAQPSFLTGMARTLDIGATLSQHSYNESPTGEDADNLALAQDFLTVGEDIRKAKESVLTDVKK